MLFLDCLVREVVEVVCRIFGVWLFGMGDRWLVPSVEIGVFIRFLCVHVASQKVLSSNLLPVDAHVREPRNRLVEFIMLPTLGSSRCTLGSPSAWRRNPQRGPQRGNACYSYSSH